MTDFVAITSPLRVHAGAQALDALPAELRRAGVRRPLLLCGPSVAAGALPGRIAAIWAQATGQFEGSEVGITHNIGGSNGRGGTAPLSIFDGLAKEAPLSRVLQAVHAARACHADGLIALGAGSVLKAARVVAILLAEDRPVEALATRYPDEGPAVSPRLPAPKLPLFNVPTVPTSAQARAGSAIAQDGDDRDRRIEFFDPKTRPVAVFWDHAALMTAPASLIAATGAAVWWRALMNIAVVSEANPLAQGHRQQAWQLADSALHVIGAKGQGGPLPRVELCAAALLQNRDEEDGGQPMQAHWVARLVYALGAAVFNRHPAISQAASYAALTGAAVRMCALDGLLPASAIPHEAFARQGMATALGLAPDTSSERLSQAIGERFEAVGLPTHLSALGLQRDELPALRDFALRNFNADPRREFRERPALLDAVLAAAW